MSPPSLPGPSPEQSPRPMSLRGAAQQRRSNLLVTWMSPVARIIFPLGDGFVRESTLLALTGLLFLSSCVPVATQSNPSQVVNIYATQATQTWLTEAFSCAAESSAILNLTDPDSAEIILRLGEAESLTTPAYQIDTEEILIVTHRESPAQNLTLQEARALFAGQGDPSVQVCVYDSGEDVQRVFDQIVMSGRSVTSSAKLATSPQQMSDLLNAEKSAVGILPKHWRAGASRIVFNAGTVPVLAVVKSEPEGVIREILACLQN